MKYGVPEEDFQAILKEIRSHLGETKEPKLYIYGSRVKGHAREFSDIDLLLSANDYDRDEMSKMDFVELDTPYKVDFVLAPDLFEAYRDEIYGHMERLEI